MSPKISGTQTYNLLDEHTEGAFYALQYVATVHGWHAHTWACKLPRGRTLFLFYATDAFGITQYFDYNTISDREGMTDRTLFFETMLETREAKARIQIGLERLDLGLDPVPFRVDAERLN